MKSTDHYLRFGLCRDMLAAPDVVRQFDIAPLRETAQNIASAGRLLLTGEGSSRLFPAKNLLQQARRRNWPFQLHSEAGRQAQEYDLSGWAVLAASNSGRTAEVIALYSALAAAGHSQRYSLTASEGSRLESLATRGFVLGCGAESAVAATKSVIEQALFLRGLGELAAGEETLPARLPHLADCMQSALTMNVPSDLVERISRAPTIYWAGRNDGVAEELTLKTNEITRQSADYLEGTYAVHGVEEVMQAGDVLIWIDPYPDAEAKFDDVLRKGVGLEIIAIASRQTRFPTLEVPAAGDLDGFVQMCAGWNVLVEVGRLAGIDLDKPQRARKVGNEFVEHSG